MLVVLADEHDVAAEAVDHRAGKTAGKAEADGLGLTGEHAEDGLGIGRHIEPGKGLFPVAEGLARGDLCHFVHAVVPDLPRRGVEGQHVVVLVVPHQRPGADLVKGAVVAVAPLLVDGVFKIAEADLLVARDGRGDLVDVVIDALVHALDPVADVDLALEQHGVVHAREAFDLADQGERLFLRDELGRLDAVDQQLELRQLEVPRADVIAHGLAARLHNVQPEFAQRVQVGVQTLALGGDAMCGELVDHLRNADGMRLVGVLQQIAHQIQKL